MKWIFGLIVACMFMSMSHRLKAQDSSQVYLQKLIEKLLSDNPQLQSARFHQQSAKAAIPVAGALPDPVLGFNLMNLPVNSFAFNRAPMTGKQITLMQHLPFPRKLDIKEDIARKKAAVREEKVRELRNQLVKQLKTVYYGLFYINRALKTVRKSKKTMKQLISAAEMRYSVGKGSQQDVLSAQLELSKLKDRQTTLRQKRSSLAAKLNMLIDAPPGQPVGMIPEPAMPQFSYTLPQLKQMANRHRPLLAAWQTVIDKSESKVSLAKKQILPDFSVGVAYTQRDVLQNGTGGVDFFSAMFKINLPIYHKRKQDQLVQEAKLMHRSVQKRYENVQNRVYQHLYNAYTKLQKNEQLVSLYMETAIPQAQQSFKAAMAAYQNGTVDFQTLMDSELSLFQERLAYYRALSDYNKNIAELEAATGLVRLDQP